MKRFLEFIWDPWGKIFLWVVFACVLSALIELSFEGCRQKRENENLHAILAAMDNTPHVADTIRDTVPVFSSPVIVAGKGELNSLLADSKLLKDIQVKPSAVETADITVRKVCDSVKMYPHVSAQLDSMPPATVYLYRDKWVDFRFSVADSTLRYAVRDSFTTIVYREYKHRFLWWRWGTKGYRVKVVNYNPHSTLSYKRYIGVDK